MQFEKPLDEDEETDEELPEDSNPIMDIMEKDLSSSNNGGWHINTFYLTDSYIMFTLKMESEPKIKIFGLKRTVKSGLEKIFLKFLHEKAIFY
jgi:hypothetical protein